MKRLTVWVSILLLGLFSTDFLYGGDFRANLFIEIDSTGTRTYSTEIRDNRRISFPISGHVAASEVGIYSTFRTNWGVSFPISELPDKFTAEFTSRGIRQQYPKSPKVDTLKTSFEWTFVIWYPYWENIIYKAVFTKNRKESFLEKVGDKEFRFRHYVPLVSDGEDLKRIEPVGVWLPRYSAILSIDPQPTHWSGYREVSFSWEPFNPLPEEYWITIYYELGGTPVEPPVGVETSTWGKVKSAFR